jgi:hypothetical protein
VNHLVVNDGVIACGFGEERADASAREILADAYPGRRVVTVDSRPIFARGGGIHCITQQTAGGGPMSGFDVVEATIAELRAALETGGSPSEGLDRAYLDRIEAYDRPGTATALNALVVMNPEALADARASTRAVAR